MRNSYILKVVVMLTCFGGFVLGGCSGSGNGGNLDGGADAISVEKITYDEVIEGCVRLHACGIESHARLSDCVNNYYDRLVSLGQELLYSNAYACANTGNGDCKIIRECMGFAGRPVECDNEYEAKCEGDVAYNCDLIISTARGWEQQLDCSKGGLKCAMKTSGTTSVAVCGGGECGTDFKQHCYNGKIYSCAGGAIEIDDCPAKGLQCRDNNALNCEGKGRSCPPLPDKCEKNIWVSCEQGYISEIDCTKLPGENKKCDEVSTRCIGDGTACSIDADFDTCDGDTLVVCVDGYKKKFDCKGIGFIGCQIETYGATCKSEHVYD